MNNNAIMKAYLDDYGRVTAIIPKNFYNGRCNNFYIIGDNAYYKNCVIRDIQETDSQRIYNLTIPTDLEFGKEYTLVEEHGLKTIIEIRFIVRNPVFDQTFAYSGKDLGAWYSPTKTTFALWAPTATEVFIEIINHNDSEIFKMKRTNKGVYRYETKTNLVHATYCYYVHVNGKVNRTVDPYALSSTANGDLSGVIDISLLGKKSSDEKCAKIQHYTDAVIYECSVRDMTSRPSSGTKTHGKFVSLCEKGTTCDGYPTGLDYLKYLSITHVQLMPIFDFATVDEHHPERQYNWGYDPMQYNCPDGSFATNPDDPYSRVRELRKMVDAMHEQGIRVNMDVVYNHMYDVGSSAFDKCVPYYYFRYNEFGYLSNGSYCGNDIDSEKYMMRKYLIDSVSMWMKLYGIDGFRFDLMGVLDVATMNLIYKTVKAINPNGMVYGEGWSLPTSLNDEKKASILNNFKMPGIAHFNDYFRDVVKGKTSDDAKYDRGYVTGDLSLFSEMCSAMVGNGAQGGYFNRFTSAEKSINTVECHDNATAWDKMKDCCKDDVREVRVDRQKMLIACSIFALGVPFLHEGEEFCGTKLGVTNSYNAGDDINGLDWKRMSKNIDVVRYTKACILLRKNLKGLHIYDNDEILRKVRFDSLDSGIMEYNVMCQDDKSINSVKIIINPSNDYHEYHYDGKWLLIMDKHGFKTNAQISDCIQSEACSVTVSVELNEG